MTWSRRQFLTGVGVLAAVSGTAGRVVEIGRAHV